MSHSNGCASELPEPKRNRHPSRFSCFQRGLNLQILTIVTVACLLSMLLASFLVLSLQRYQCIENTQKTNRQWASVVQASLLPSMQDRNHAAIEHVIRALADRTHMESIRLLNAAGDVWLSSRPAEIGQLWEDGEVTDLFGTMTGSGSQPYADLIRKHKAHEDAVTLHPLYNEAACQTCHGSQIETLGLLMIETPLSSLQRRTTEGLWRVFLSIAITFALLVGVLAFFLQRLLARPVCELSRGVSEIANGNLDHTLVIDSSGNELGALALSFEEMRRQLKRSTMVMEQQNQELWLLNRLDIQISASLDAKHVLETVAEGARHLLEGDIGMVGLYDDTDEDIHIKVVAGDGAITLQGMRLPVQDGRMVWPAVIDNYQPGIWGSEEDDRLVRAAVVSILAVPVRQQDRLLGLIAVMTRQHRHFSDNEMRVLNRLADQMATAMENARLHKQVHHLATLEERERLAREMHDRLAQMLGFLNIKASLIDEQLSQQRVTAARNELREIKDVLKEGYIDVREAILNLRTDCSPSSAFVPMLQGYLTDYHLHYGLQTRLQLGDLDTIQLPPDASIQLLRIIQEALTNVRKHAQASQAWIRFSENQGTVRICIEDDGQGFDPSQIEVDSRSYFGLQIMRERAESVGGILTMNSSPGQGTQVVVQVPYPTERETG